MSDTMMLYGSEFKTLCEYFDLKWVISGVNTRTGEAMDFDKWVFWVEAAYDQNGREILWRGEEELDDGSTGESPRRKRIK
ncbi:MAG: hypothetical protein ABR953_03830 [Candidatus Acidiferrales bacterium]